MHPSEATATGLLGLCPDGLRVQTDPDEIDLDGEWPAVVETHRRLHLVDGAHVRVWEKFTPVLRRRQRASALDVEATETPVAGRHWYWAEEPAPTDPFGGPQRRLAGIVEQVRTVRPVGGTRVVEGVRFHALPRQVVGDPWMRPTCRFVVHLKDGAMWLLDLPAARFIHWASDGGDPQVFEGIGVTHLERGFPVRITVIPDGGTLTDLEVGEVAHIVAEVPLPC